MQTKSSKVTPVVAASYYLCKSCTFVHIKLTHPRDDSFSTPIPTTLVHRSGDGKQRHEELRYRLDKSWVRWFARNTLLRCYVQLRRHRATCKKRNGSRVITDSLRTRTTYACWVPLWLSLNFARTMELEEPVGAFDYLSVVCTSVTLRSTCNKKHV